MLPYPCLENMMCWLTDHSVIISVKMFQLQITENPTQKDLNKKDNAVSYKTRSLEE